MSEDEYFDFIDNQLQRQKVLAPYEDFVKARLELCEDASAASAEGGQVRRFFQIFPQ